MKVMDPKNGNKRKEDKEDTKNKIGEYPFINHSMCS